MDYRIDFYILNLSRKIKNKIMNDDDKNSLVNLKNINFINIVDRYKRDNKKHYQIDKSTVLIDNLNSQELNEGNILSKEYFGNYVYMLKERMIGMLKDTKDIPMHDKILIETELNNEYKERKSIHKDAKNAIANLLSNNIILYKKIENINGEIQVTL